MPTETIPFTGFAFGEYGSLSPFTVGFQVYRAHLLYKGWWTGANILRGQDGTLFPRAGEKPYILTGVPNGTIEGMGFADTGGHLYIWFAVGTSVYRFRADVFTSQAVTQYTGSFTAFTEPLAWVDHSGVSYVFAYPNGQYKLDHGAASITAISGSPAAFNCCVYGNRLMAGGAATLYYTTPDPAGIVPDFENWTADGFIEIGDAFNIRSLNTVRGRLAIGKDGVVTQPWFVLSGVPGFNDVLRQAEASLTPPHAEAAVDTGQGVGLVTDVEGNLAIFDGSRLNMLPHLQVTSGPAHGFPSELSAFTLRRPGEWGVVVDKTIDAHDPNNGSIWIHRNGAWSRHTRATPAGIRNGGWSVSVPAFSRLVFGQGGDGSTPATFCAFNPYLERPPFTSDAGTTILAPSGCAVSLPEWWARDGSEVAVTSIIVDFKAWNTGDSNRNQFRVAPAAMRTYDPESATGGTGDIIADQPASGASSGFVTQTYSEATSAASTAGSRRRVHYRFVPVWGNGFRIDIGQMRGVSIEKVVAVCQTRPAQGVA